MASDLIKVYVAYSTRAAGYSENVHDDHTNARRKKRHTSASRQESISCLGVPMISLLGAYVPFTFCP